jgi:hypothetical protein
VIGKNIQNRSNVEQDRKSLISPISPIRACSRHANRDMPEPMSNAEPAALKQRVIGRPFQPGQSGNPKGRSKGSRAKLSESFLEDLRDSWLECGAVALKRAADEDPVGYCKIIAGLLPRDVNLNMTLDVAEFAGNFRQALAMLGNEPLPRPKRPMRVINHAK